MGHSYNHGLVTSMKGATIEAVRITDLDAADNVVAEQSASGLVASSAIASGLVTVQLAAPYPPRLVVCLPALSGATTTTDLAFARYVDDSYDADAGTFQIALSNDDDTGAPLALSPSATVELHILMIFCRYTGI
jgi:hypothetical protein